MLTTESSTQVNVRQVLIKEIEQTSDYLLSEVLDFLLFIRAKHSPIQLDIQKNVSELVEDYDDSKLKIQFTDVFKRPVRDLAKRYRRIKFDIQPVLDQLQSGELVGDQIQGTGYTVFKVRIKNSDIQKGKSGGYRLIYYIKTSENILCVLIYSKSDEDNVTSLEIKKTIQEFYD